MTSLERQLERLAVPHTRSALGQDKRRASLLFDPKEAANLDRETVFALGISGLEELETIDDLFEDFESTLFNKNSTDWERSMQTKEVNKKLDATIQEFLITLSPYFLLKSAHKALEWLVYRYHIHEFNKDEVLLCALPYHDSKIFVRLLQLMDLKNPADKWHWLEASAKHGASLARSTLCNHCKKDPGFLAFLCDLLPKFIKVHGPTSAKLRAIIGLYTCAMLGTLQVKEEISEKIVSVLVPRLVQGVKSKCVDYTAATYMVLSQLAVQTNLKQDLLNTLINVMTKKIKPTLTLEVLTCLAVLFQTQKITELPKKSFKHLSKVPGLVQLLASLASRYTVAALTRAYVSRLLPCAVHAGIGEQTSSDASEEFSDGTPQYASILTGVIQSVPMPDAAAAHLARQLLDQLIERRRSIDDVEAVNKWTRTARTLLSATQSRYGDALDAAVESVLSKNKDDAETMAILQEVTSLTLVPAKYQQIDSGVSLLLAMNHATASTRQLAVRHVVTRLQEGKFEGDDFVVTSLLNRLSDDAPSVVTEVLQLGTLLCSLLKEEDLLAAVTSLLRSRYTGTQDKNWHSVAIGCVDVLRHLASKSRAHAEYTCTLLLPYTLVLNSKAAHQIEFARRVMGVLPHCAATDDFSDAVQDWLKKCDGESKLDSSSILALNDLVFKATARWLGGLGTEKADEIFIAPIMRLVASQKDHAAALFLLCVAMEMLQVAKSREHIVFAARRILSVLKAIQVPELRVTRSYDEICVTESLTGGAMREALTCLESQLAVSGTAYFTSLNVMLAKLAGVDSDVAPLMVDCLELMMSRACARSYHQSAWQYLLTHFVRKRLTPDQLLHLCNVIWLRDDVSPVLHVGSFHLLANWMKTTDVSMETLLQDGSPFLATLLSALCCSEAGVRAGALLCIKTLRRRAKEHAHAATLKRLVKQEAEIESDAAHAQQSLGVLFAADDNTDELSRHASSRRETLTYLLKVIVDRQCPEVLQERVLQLVSHVPHQLVLDEILALGTGLLEKVKNGTAEHQTYAILEYVINRFDEVSAKEMTEGSTRLKLFVMALDTHDPNISVTPSQNHAIKQSDKAFFGALPDVAVQQRIVTSLVDVAVGAESSAVLGTCMHALKHVRLEAAHVQHELQASPLEAATVKARKRTRSKEHGDDIVCERVKVVLEALQARSKVKDSHGMTALLFGVLKSLLSREREEGEYCKQLVLSSLHNYCSKWTADTKPENQESLSVELLVQCIRSSRSPQTQQQALLVMAAVAHLFPEYILHHAMSIFTFMGDSMLHQDDSHTFQVITNTLNTLIPAIVQAHGEEPSSGKLHELITDILQVFVAARHHIPKHRCHVLFRTLLGTVGAEEYTWRLMLLVVESAVRGKDVPSVQDTEDIMQKDMSSIDRDLEFVCQISEKFRVRDQLLSAVRVIRFLQQLTLVNYDRQASGASQPRSKARTGREGALHPLTVATLSAQQLRLIEYHATRLVAELFSSGAVIAQILEELEGGSDVFKELLQSFIQECLSLVTAVAKAFGVNSNTTSVKFWRALLGKVYDILDKVNVLIPTSVFLQLISSLMSHQQLTVRKKSLELLSTKLQQLDPSVLTPEEVESLLLVVGRLSGVLGEEPPAQEAELMVQVKQISLYSLRLLCKMLGNQHPQSFTQLFSPVTSLLSADAAAPVLGGALVCVGELCASLKAHAIPALTRFMPALLPILANDELVKTSDTLLVCCLTAVQKILSSLAHFLSPYLKQILQSVCNLSTLITSDVPPESANKNHPAVRLRNVRHHLAVDLAPRLLLPVVTETYDCLLAEKLGGMACLLHVLQEHIEHISREDLAANNAQLLSIFLRVLDVRNQLGTSAESLGVEDLSIDALLAMVVRLSELTFRPLYYKLYNWACLEDTAESRIRRLTFFKLSARLSERLKSLFNLFVGHSIKITCQLLEENNSSVKEVRYYGDGEAATSRSCELLRHTLCMLASCFRHDTEGFVTRDIFTALSKPLVNQLENALGDEGVYETRISDHVVPCITQLAVAARDDVSCKTLNYQICLKTRHDSTKVRIAALACVEQLAQKLGDDYVSLLPETIPFLAELMEDESEDVEQQCQQVVTSLEQLLGESLQKYF